MSYDTWLTIAYEHAIPLALDDLDNELADNSADDDDDEYKDLDFFGELYTLANNWHPAIDARVPPGRVIVRYGVKGGEQTQPL